MSKTISRLCPDTICDEMRERRWTLSKLAEKSGIERQVLFDCIQSVNFKPLTEEVARGLSRAFGTGSQFWMELQKLSEAYNEKA